MPVPFRDIRVPKTYSLPHSLHEQMHKRAARRKGGNASRVAEHYIRLGMQAETGGMKLEEKEDEIQRAKKLEKLTTI